MMHDPAASLLAFLLFFAVVVLFVWPRRGVLARWKRLRRSTERVHVEDALKHLHDCEYKRLLCTRQSLAGALGINQEEAARLLVRLESLGLVSSEGEGATLTNAGRTYALRVIRIHRLWERYLADETGLRETDWHHEAERTEHILTPEEANALSASLGEPRFDPHGDPIPTAAGDIPERQGYPLTQLPVGLTAEVLHVEDEPHGIYAKLVDLGILPGMRLRLSAMDKERVLFEADGIQHALPPVAAANITVRSLAQGAVLEGRRRTLAELRPGDRGRVTGLARTLRGTQRRRMLDLGIVPGTVVGVEMVSAGGDPTAYSVRGAMIGLRRQQARQVFVEPEQGTAGGVQ